MDLIDHSSGLRAIVRSLEQDVIPVVHDEYVRGQLWATTGLLANIANELDPELDPGRNPAIDRGADASHLTGEELHRSLLEAIATHSSLHYLKALGGYGSSETKKG